MLIQLNVKNFALVDQLELDLHQGMTAVTGETGAGKSIMLDALGLALGDRSDAGVIGIYGDKSEVNASFDLSNNKDALAWLEHRALLEDDHSCILRRVINKDGRSKGFINGSPSTVSDLKALGEMLIDIHSQHEHQSLLRKDNHSRLLDEYASSQALAREVTSTFALYQKQKNQLDELINNNDEQTKRLQLLSYQAEELEQLDITENEAEALAEEQKKLANAETVLTNCDQALNLCGGGDNSSMSSASEQLAKSIQLLEQLNLEDLGGPIEMLSSARIQVDEASIDLSRFSSSFEIDPRRLEQVEERLSVIYDLSRKHRIETNEIPALTQRILAELESLKNIDVEVLAAEKRLEALNQKFLEQAKKLSKKRNSAATKLRKSVSAQLKELGMGGASFDIALTAFEEQTPSAKGLEEIEFLISTNPGQTPKPLNKIASGGELSRISLAIQVATADTSQIPSLVFDEVDVGIGGGTAEVVGKLLRQLGEQAQIICVTHLAQVAAQGHQHLKVQKQNTGVKKPSKTNITELKQDLRIEELARMMGGVEITEQTLAHAKEMLDASQG